MQCGNIHDVIAGGVFWDICHEVVFGEKVTNLVPENDPDLVVPSGHVDWNFDLLLPIRHTRGLSNARFLQASLTAH